MTASFSVNLNLHNQSWPKFKTFSSNWWTPSGGESLISAANKEGDDNWSRDTKAAR